MAEIMEPSAAAALAAQAQSPEAQVPEEQLEGEQATPRADQDSTPIVVEKVEEDAQSEKSMCKIIYDLFLQLVIKFIKVLLILYWRWKGY